MSDLPLVKPDQFSVKSDPARAIEFLRRRHPVKTAECVEAVSGVPLETVRQWLKGVSKPGWFHGLALVSAYGPEFLAAALPNAPSWLDAAVRAQKRAALEAELALLKHRIAEVDSMPTKGFRRVAWSAAWAIMIAVCRIFQLVAWGTLTLAEAANFVAGICDAHARGRG